VGKGTGGGGLLAVKSAKPCHHLPSCPDPDPRAAGLQTRGPFSEHGVHVAGGVKAEREYPQLKLPLSSITHAHTHTHAHRHTHTGINITFSRAHTHTHTHTYRACLHAINTSPEDAGHASYLHFKCFFHSIIQIVTL